MYILLNVIQIIYSHFSHLVIGEIRAKFDRIKSFVAIITDMKTKKKKTQNRDKNKINVNLSNESLVWKNHWRFGNKSES